MNQQFIVENLAVDDKKKGRYLMDYSRKYGDPYDINDKAREHVQQMRQEQNNHTK